MGGRGIGRSKSSGKFVSRQVVDAAIQHDAAVAADGDPPPPPAGGTFLTLDDLVIPVPTRPRSTRGESGLDDRTRLKLERLQRDYKAERARSANLSAELAAARIERSALLEKCEEDVEKERRKLTTAKDQLASTKSKLQYARNALISARAVAKRKAAAAADKARDRASTKLDAVRVDHRAAAAKDRDQARLQREADRDLAAQQISEAEGRAKKARVDNEELAQQLAATEKETVKCLKALQCKEQQVQELKQIRVQQAAVQKGEIKALSVKHKSELRNAKQSLSARPAPKRPTTSPKTQVPASDGSYAGTRARYDWIRNQALKLKAHLQRLYTDGPFGISTLEVISYLLEHHMSFAVQLFIELQLPQAIEKEVVDALNNWWTTSKAAAQRLQTGMTWEGWRVFSSTLYKTRNPETGKYDNILMPYGSAPPVAPLFWKLWKFEKEVEEAFGLSESKDGITAWVDLIKVLELRLNAIPKDFFPPLGALIRLFFGADAYRQYQENNTKVVLCAVKPMVERRDVNHNRLKGWAYQSTDNAVKAALYEGGDSYLELSTKGSEVQKQIFKVKKTGLRIWNEQRMVKVGLYGDMMFLSEACGEFSLNSNNPCIGCDVHSDHIMKTLEEFEACGIPPPKPMTLERRNKLSHAYGPEYGLEEPYTCEGCKKLVTKDRDHEPTTSKLEKAYPRQHFGQMHGRPPLFQTEHKDIVCCSMHGEHNTRAQTWYATVGQNLYSDAMVAAVNTVLHEKWKMNHHKAKKIDPKQGLTKESALHFNGPEGIVVDARRGEVLDISAKNNRVMADALWEAQDYMFSIWRTVEYDPTKWKALADKARAAARDYRDIFMAMTGGNDGTITMHYAMYHWPEHIEEHGSLCHTNAQNLEASNQECKGIGKKKCNRQQKRTTKTGATTRGRMAQILARTIQKQVALVNESAPKLLKRHNAKNKTL